jgi:cation-transporting ATPase E
VAEGRTNAPDQRDGRTLWQIFRANVFTPFNGILTTLFVVIMTTGRWQNALFGFVVIFNSTIGIIQELRARSTLDKLAVLNAPMANIVRDGVVKTRPVEAVVADDVLEIRTGDQIVADGVVRSSTGLAVDESLLTGESDPITKHEGSEVRSGSIVVSGIGRFQATAVGGEAYAAQITADARRFSLTYSELRAGANTLLRWISIIMAVTAPIIVWRQFASPDNADWRDAVTGSVAALIGMVPDGLVLLTSMAFVLGAVVLARRNTLVQELPAVEGLARVDVVCLDKTGTLTHGEVQLDRVEVLDEDISRDSHSDDAYSDDAHRDDAHSDIDEALAMLAGDGANATAAAIGQRHPVSSWNAEVVVPFSSARKWSAASSLGHGTWVIGAPEMVLPGGDNGGDAGAPASSSNSAEHDAVSPPLVPSSLSAPSSDSPGDDLATRVMQRCHEIAAQGSRVLLLARSEGPIAVPDDGAEAPLPEGLVPVALVVMAEKLREDAPETLEFFAEQGVDLIVISGDNPRTVGAVAAHVGIPGVTCADDAYDARNLPEDQEALADVLEDFCAFGRVTPAQKRAIVGALQSRGHVVAMTGDGVNDALALKDADIGVAMGEGSAATRAVAQLVLLDGRFAHLPVAVAEGRRVIANIERAANLFLIRNAYSLVLAMVTAITATAYPLAPIQMTMISSLTIGIPGFFLALGPNRRRYIPGFYRRVLKFAIPTGAVVAAVAYTAFSLTRHILPHASVADARTSTALAVLVVCLWTVSLIARPINGWKVLLISGLVTVAVVIVLTPMLGHGIFLFTGIVSWHQAAVIAGLGLVGGVLVSVIYRVVGTKDVRDESRVRMRDVRENARISRAAAREAKVERQEVLQRW